MKKEGMILIDMNMQEKVLNKIESSATELGMKVEEFLAITFIILKESKMQITEIHKDDIN